MTTTQDMVNRPPDHKQHKCNFCGIYFSSSNNMKIHISALHEGKKPFNCSSCDARFLARSTLKNHILCVHDRIKPHKCSICAKYILLNERLFEETYFNSS